MNDFFTALIKVGIESPRYFLSFSMVVLLFLLLPESIIATLGLNEFRFNHRHWIGLSFLTSFSIGVVWLVLYICKGCKSKINTYRYNKKICMAIKNLNEDEMKIIRHYIQNNTRCNYLDINDGIVNRLRAIGIIHMSADISIGGSIFAHNISDVALEYINKNHLVISGSTNECRNDDERIKW